MQTIRLSLTSEDESETHTVALTFDDQEISLLGRYLANCNRLQQAAIFAAGFPVVQNFTWTPAEGTKFKISPIDYSQVCELLHLARPFFLAKEDSSFDRILELFKGKAEGTALQRHLEYIRDSYVRGDYQPYFQISINEVPLFDDATIKTWLNGAEYHQDRNKAAVVAKLESALTTEVARGIFVSQLSGRVRAVFMLRHLSELIVSGGKNVG